MASLARGRWLFAALGALAVALIAGAIVILSRGGGDSSDAAQDFDASVTAGDGMFETARLPGRDWAASDGVLQQASAGETELVSSAPSTAECEGLRVLERALAGTDQAFVSGTTRTAEQRNGERLLAWVSQSRITFSDAGAAETAVAELEHATNDPQFAACLETAAAMQGTAATVAAQPPRAAARGGGGARAYAFSMGGEGGERMIEHIYWWSEGAAVSTIVIATWGGDADVPAILEATGKQ